MNVWDFLEGEEAAVPVMSSNAKEAALHYGVELLDECGSDYIDIGTRDEAGKVRKFRVRQRVEYDIDEVTK